MVNLGSPPYLNKDFLNMKVNCGPTSHCYKNCLHMKIKHGPMEINHGQPWSNKAL